MDVIEPTPDLLPKPVKRASTGEKIMVLLFPPAGLIAALVVLCMGQPRRAATLFGFSLLLPAVKILWFLASQ